MSAGSSIFYVSTGQCVPAPYQQCTRFPTRALFVPAAASGSRTHKPLSITRPPTSANRCSAWYCKLGTGTALVVRELDRGTKLRAVPYWVLVLAVDVSTENAGLRREYSPLFSPGRWAENAQRARRAAEGYTRATFSSRRIRKLNAAFSAYSSDSSVSNVSSASEPIRSRIAFALDPAVSKPGSTIGPR
eukprot:3077023-Rhodomonas_salina.5